MNINIKMAEMKHIDVCVEILQNSDLGKVYFSDYAKATGMLTYAVEQKGVFVALDENEKYILVEDDIVTGSTLINYLDSAVANNICITSVVAVFVRKNNYEQIKEQILKKFGIKLYGLIEVE